MVFEDEADFVELVAYNSRKEGFEARSFSRGNEGREDLRRKGADLVILDVMLPDRHRLLDEVWGPGRFVPPRIVDVHMRRLREKIEARTAKPLYLRTVRGASYRVSGKPGDELAS